MHISTLLGAQGAETEKTWIQTIYNDSKNNIMCRDTCTMQLQIYIIFEKLWHKMSFKQRLKSGFGWHFIYLFIFFFWGGVKLQRTKNSFYWYFVFLNNSVWSLEH